MARLFCCPGCGVEISPQHIVPGLSSLTPQQQELVTLLAEKPGHFVTADEIARVLWGWRKKANHRNSIDVQVARIRKRLGRRVIETRKTLGYRLTLDSQPEYVINSPINKGE